MPKTLRKPNRQRMSVEIPRPTVKVKAPPVTVESPDVTTNVDTAAIAQVIAGLSQQIAALGELMLQTMAAHDRRLIEHAERVETLLERLAEAPAPVINVPASKGKAAGNGYDIALVRDDEDNEILGMRLRPVRTGN